MNRPPNATSFPPAPATEPAPSPNPLFSHSPYLAALTLGLLVFAASLLGILSRPENFLASIWPANAIMLGMLLRVRATATPGGWMCAIIAYLAADLLTGASVFMAVMLTTANLASVSAGYLIYRSLPPAMAQLRHPTAMLYLVLASAAAGASAGLIGSFAHLLLFSGSPFSGWVLWFVTEFVNYVAILPVLLAAPSWRGLKHNRRRWQPIPVRACLPALTLVLSCLVAAIVGGPGAIAFPVPALLWCALSYPVFPTTLLTLFSGIWSLIVVASTHTPLPEGENEMLLISLRLGASLMALAPITLSCVMQNRNELLSRLQHLATHDSLTGLSNRGAFYEAANHLLASTTAPVGVLMIDIDHFKRINDRHGHAAGDAVLQTVAQRIRQGLRTTDLVGRIGGEEFAAALPGHDAQALSAVAERIRSTIETEHISLPGGVTLPVTVSLGITVGPPGKNQGIDPLLAEADSAMYLAKEAGRNRVVTASAATETPPAGTPA